MKTSIDNYIHRLNQNRILLFFLLAGIACNKDLWDKSMVGLNDMRIETIIYEHRRVDIFGEDENGMVEVIETRFEDIHAEHSGKIQINFTKNRDVWFTTDYELLSFRWLKIHLPDTIYLKKSEKFTYFDGGWNHSHRYEFELMNDYSINATGRISDGFGSVNEWRVRIIW